jgi:mRNA interferase RelE/StbE
LAVYEVRFSNTARKGLRRLRGKDRERVTLAAEALGENPRPRGARLVEGTPFLRIRSGNYRIIYEVRDNVLLVLVVRVAHRKDAYRNL